jgi:hypothetical protein
MVKLLARGSPMPKEDIIIVFDIVTTLPRCWKKISVVFDVLTTLVS